MQDLRDSEEIEVLRPLQPVVLGVLCQVGEIGLPKQETGIGDAGCDQQKKREPWPGADFGVRCPEPGETPLSMAEVEHAFEIGLIVDDESSDRGWPVRPHKAVGAWEKRNMNLMRKAGPFDGLIA